MLEARGIIVRHPADRGKAVRYELTPAGEGLTPIVWAMGHWAAEWAFGDPSDEQLDGVSLLWRLHQHACPSASGRTYGGPRRADRPPRRGRLARHQPERHDGVPHRSRPRRRPRGAGRQPANASVAPRAGPVPVPDRGRRRAVARPGKPDRAFPTWFDTSLFAAGLRRAETRRTRDAELVAPVIPGRVGPGSPDVALV